MKNKISFKLAQELIEQNTHSINSFVYLSTFDALGKICFEDIKATQNAPCFNNSAMDGYVVSTKDIGKRVKIDGAIFAGDKTIPDIKENHCLKIMTGAILPKNFGCVVPFECAIEADEQYATMPKDYVQNQNCRIKGEEFNTKTTLIKKGEILTPQKITLLSSMGITNIKVFRLLKIAIISTGDEIKEPWQSADEFEIYNSNSTALQMLLKQYGFDSEYKGIFPDSLQACTDFISTLKDYDAIITTGGVSMGEADFVSQAFLDNGMQGIFHKIKLKPGHPMLFGKIQNTSIFALPGNPMSSFLTCYTLVLPYLFKLNGSYEYTLNEIQVKNNSEFKTPKNKTNIVLGEIKNSKFHAIDDNKYNSGMISPIVKANAIAIIQEEDTIIKKDEILKIIPMYSPMIKK